MKAHEGEKIVCKCAEPAGKFDRDVDDRASISCYDIKIFTWLCTSDGPDRWVCLTCKEPVAELLSGDHYRVRTRKGWLE